MTTVMKTDPSGWQIRWNEEDARRYRAEGHWTESTLTDAARAAVAEDPDRIILIEGDTHFTRSQTWEQALRLANFFLSRGLKPGDVISFQLPNWIEAAIVALAARMVGVVVNPIPPIYRGSELAYIIANCGAKMIFVPEVFRKHDFRSMLDELRPSLPSLEEVIVVRGTGGFSWEQALALPPADDAALPKVDPSAVMMVMYTSGTTGKPKGVLHNHYDYDHRVRTMGTAWGACPDDVVFMPSPVSHITGAFWAFDMPWVKGCRSVLIDVVSGDDGVKCIEKNRCTVTGGATPFLQQLLDMAGDRPEAIASLRLFFCGGTTVSPDLIRQCSERFPAGLFFRCYGSTEMTCATLGIHDPSQAEYGAVTDGEVVPPTEAKIVDAETGAPLPEGEEGEIIARGPGLFVGYLNPADNEGCFDDDGFFRMGDLGRQVDGNYLVITGRKKDIIIRSGENISPKEVEDALYLHPAVADVAIVAMPSKKTGEMGCAFIIPRAGQTLDLEEIKRFLEEAGLAKQKFPEHLVLVDDLPRVPSGKVKKDLLRLRAKEIAEAV